MPVMPPTIMSNIFSRDAITEGLPNPEGDRLANLSIVFCCLSAFFVTSRMLTRVFINKLVGADDYLIVVAMVRSIG